MFRLGAVPAVVEGRDDRERLLQLRMRCAVDFEKVESFRTFDLPESFVVADHEGQQVPRRISVASFSTLHPVLQAEMFEQVYVHHGIEGSPLICITPVDEGILRIDGERLL